MNNVRPQRKYPGGIRENTIVNFERKAIVWQPDGEAPQEVLENAQGIGESWSGKVSSSQVRRYYNEVKRLEAKVNEDKQEGWEKNMLEVKLLKAKVAYALRDDRKLASRLPFVSYLQDCLDKVNSRKDFEFFVKHFEAVLGFAHGSEKGLKEERD